MKTFYAAIALSLLGSVAAPAQTPPLSINLGSSANDRSGDPLRTAFQKIQTNVNSLNTYAQGTNASLVQLLSSRGTSGGIATLGSDGKIPALQMPTGLYDSNVRSFGATLSGSSDTTAFRAARAAAPRNGIIVVPPGCMNADIPVDSAKAVLWQLSGTVYCGGTVPVSGIGSDIVETFLPNNGGRFWSATATTPNSQAVGTFQRTVTHDSGNGVLDTLRVNTEVRSNSTGFFNFGVTSAMYDYTPGSNSGGNNVAIYGQYNRETGNTPGWSMALETNDRTNTLSSQNGGTLGAEILLRANRADDGTRRIVLDLVQGKALPRNSDDTGTYEESEIYAFVRANNVFGSTSEGHAKIGYSMEAPVTEAAFDASKATYPGSNAIAYRLKADSRIDFKGDASRTLMWNSGGALQYNVGNTLSLELKDDGTFSVFGMARVGGFSQPDSTAPTGRTDPTGSVNDVRYSGSRLYRKTTSGWYYVDLNAMP